MPCLWYPQQRPYSRVASTPSGVYRVEMITRAVEGQHHEGIDEHADHGHAALTHGAQATLARACAWGVEPIPASLENRPRFAPWLMAIFSAAPKPPPMMAWGLKAYLKIMPKVAGTYLMRAMSIAQAA